LKVLVTRWYVMCAAAPYFQLQFMKKRVNLIGMTRV
jgi:hypothetical protein